MATISTFELYVKRIGAPGGLSFPSGSNPFRKLLQGYYLTIANINKTQNASLRMQAIFPKINTNSPFTQADRELVSGTSRNHVYAYDRTGDNSTSASPRELFGPMTEYVSNNNCRTFQTKTFNLKACETGLVNLVPSPAAIAQGNPQIEIRGYIKMVQVDKIIFRRIGNFYRIDFVVPPPVNLMFTPEIRGTFVDDNFNPIVPSNGGLDFDQSNYALPTATGAAIIKVTESINPFLIPFPNPVPVPVGGINIGRLMLNELIDVNKLEGTINYVGEFNLNDKVLKRIETSLKKNKLGKEYLNPIKNQIEQIINNSNFEIKRGSGKK